MCETSRYTSRFPTTGGQVVAVHIQSAGSTAVTPIPAAMSSIAERRSS